VAMLLFAKAVPHSRKSGEPILRRLQGFQKPAWRSILSAAPNVPPSEGQQAIDLRGSLAIFSGCKNKKKQENNFCTRQPKCSKSQFKTNQNTNIQS